MIAIRPETILDIITTNVDPTTEQAKRYQALSENDKKHIIASA